VTCRDLGAHASRLTASQYGSPRAACLLHILGGITLVYQAGFCLDLCNAYIHTYISHVYVFMSFMIYVWAWWLQKRRTVMRGR
jgi:hypothetical protein